MIMALKKYLLFLMMKISPTYVANLEIIQKGRNKYL